MQTTIFRKTPAQAETSPALCSSLQSFETMLHLLGYQRYPHALVLGVTAIENALRAFFRIRTEEVVSIRTLLRKVGERVPELSEVARACAIGECVNERNRIIHDGYSPADNSVSVSLLVGSVIPYLKACYRKCFAFELLDGLLAVHKRHLDAASRVYNALKKSGAEDASCCITAYSHFMKWNLARGVAPDDASFTYINDARFQAVAGLRDQMIEDANAAWAFDCPVCEEPECCVATLRDFSKPDEIAVESAICANCGFRIPAKPACMAEEYLGKQLKAKRTEIFENFEG